MTFLKFSTYLNFSTFLLFLNFQTFPIYYHAKSGGPSSKIGQVIAIFKSVTDKICDMPKSLRSTLTKALKLLWNFKF